MDFRFWRAISHWEGLRQRVIKIPGFLLNFLEFSITYLQNPGISGTWVMTLCDEVEGAIAIGEWKGRFPVEGEANAF